MLALEKAVFQAGCELKQKWFPATQYPFHNFFLISSTFLMDMGIHKELLEAGGTDCLCFLSFSSFLPRPKWKNPTSLMWLLEKGIQRKRKQAPWVHESMVQPQGWTI